MNSVRMKKVLVTGADGQFGKCIRDAHRSYSELEFVFVSKAELNIENQAQLEGFFSLNSFDYCINTAAYTNVEQAESEPEKAFKLNADAVRSLAECCKSSNTTLLHISTDYVFDGQKGKPYTETDVPNPINVYGASKLKGEQYIQDICEKYFIIRTSWLYSQYGHNFLKTVLKFGGEGKVLTVTTEQKGTPTNANDLAALLLKIIKMKSLDYGVYHFSNAGETTWFGFAEAILEAHKELDPSILAKTEHYRTFAKRPLYSVLDNSKINMAFGNYMKEWKESLQLIINKELTISKNT